MLELTLLGTCFILIGIVLWFTANSDDDDNSGGGGGYGGGHGGGGYHQYHSKSSLDNKDGGPM